MKTPVTDNFFNHGREWAGVPSPNSALLFCRQMESELAESRRREALASQTISIARQTIGDQRKYIERLEKEKFAAAGGTEGRGASSLPSCPGGDLCQTCGGAISNDCALCGAPQCCAECCRKNTAETMLRREVYGIIEYWQGVSECNCGAETPIGACLKCDMEKLEDRTSELLLVVASDSLHNAGAVTPGENEPKP